MARIRSPNYPAISLAEAINRIAQVHQKERQHPAVKEVILKGMGYGGVHGTSLGALSAALKYGLLEQEGKGDDYRVSDRAVAILHPHTPDEKAQAIRDAARAPALFSELLEHFKGDLPSDDNLRAYLVRRGFSQTSLPGVIQAFRDTMELVTPESEVYTGNGPAFVQSVPVPAGAQLNMGGAATSAPKQTYTASTLVEHGVSQSTLSIKDEKVEIVAVLFDQENLQKVVDRLLAIKSLLPEKPPKADEMKETAN